MRNHQTKEAIERRGQTKIDYQECKHLSPIPPSKSKAQKKPEKEEV